MGGDLDWFARYLCGLPFPFEVLTPDIVRAEVAAHARRLLGYVGAADGTDPPRRSVENRYRPAVRTRRFHYAWVVFAASFVTLLGAAGFRSTPGILIDPLREEFGWSRATVGTAVSINLLLFGFIGPFAAALQARYGLRRVTVVALTVISLGALGTTRMSEPWQLFLLWGVVVGVGSGCMATVFASTVASRWFVARRGLVTGALTAATASGQLVFLPLLSRLAEGVGWRWVGVTIAIGALAVVPIVVLFLRDRPEDMGLLPYGATEAVPARPVGPRHPTRPRRVRRARRRLAQRRVLAAVRQLLRVRAVDERADPDPLPVRRPRPLDQRVVRSRATSP